MGMIDRQVTVSMEAVVRLLGDDINTLILSSHTITVQTDLPQASVLKRLPMNWGIASVKDDEACAMKTFTITVRDPDFSLQLPEEDDQNVCLRSLLRGQK